MPAREPPAYEDVVSTLARSLAGDGEVTDDVRRRAEEMAETAGIRVLVETLAVAERVLRTGEGFHSIERFFVDESEEQRYVRSLRERP
jgi:hypothetical protein